ncbi:MAG: type 4a pilus biogenesis protein PilO [Planctomycetota bacterium]|nr:type 4a pilus biogenesis protein PilO [Planctomycetota bacterium]
MKLGIRETIFIAVLVGVLACAYFVIFQKANAHRIAVEADTQSKRQKLADLQSATAGISDLNHKIDELQRAIDFFQSKLPQQREVETILNEVTQLSQANGLKSKTFRTFNGEVTPNYAELPIDLNLSGDFTGFYSFLLQLEKLPRLTRVTHMKLEKINEHDGQMTANVTLSIFYEPEQLTSTVSAR